VATALQVTDLLEPAAGRRTELRPAPGTSLRAVGLFAGIGGIELGLAAAGHRTKLLCEIDQAARTVLARHAKGVPIRHDVKRMRQLPPCDLLAAGFPCQDLSQAGRTAGIRGPSGLAGTGGHAGATRPTGTGRDTAGRFTPSPLRSTGCGLSRSAARVPPDAERGEDGAPDQGRAHLAADPGGVEVWVESGGDGDPGGGASGEVGVELGVGAVAAWAG
jgi:C-5 cytosine-specific DNA methylase